MVRRVALLVASVLILGACRVDIVVDLVVEPDGTGQLVVTATTDAEVVEQLPGLAQDLRFDDAVAAGWTVDGPAPTDAGGLTVTLRHAVSSPQEATNLLASLGPPFVGGRLERSTAGDTTTTSLSGQLVLTGGFDAFADSDLLAAVGGTPFAEDLAASGATPTGNLSVRLRVELPGEVETTGAGSGGVVTWDAPLDGTALELTTRAEQRPAPGWASIVSTTALVLLVLWLVVLVVISVSVVKLRRRRSGGRLGPAGTRRLEELDAW